MNSATVMSLDALQAAIVNDDREQVAVLLNADGELSRREFEQEQLHEAGIFHWIYGGDTALHLAAAGYRVEIVRLLLTAGADPNSAKNRRRSTPFHYAADGFITGSAWNPVQQVETLRLLVSAGADFQSQDRNGATALHRAVRCRCAAAVNWLLSAGCDPSRRNKSGSTPFHLAVQNSGRGGSGEEFAKSAQTQIVEQFLAAGVSVQLRDGKGCTVQDIASRNWTRELLAKPGA